MGTTKKLTQVEIHNDRAVELLNRGDTKASIAKELGCSLGTVSRIKKANFIETPKRLTQIEIHNDAVMALINKGFDIGVTAMKVGCDINTVVRIRNANGIKKAKRAW